MIVNGYQIEENKYLINPFAPNLLEIVSKYEEFCLDFKLDRLTTVKYLILMYDMKTSLKIDVRDFWERRHAAAIVAGFKLNGKKKFDDDVEDMLLGGNDAVNSAMTKYIMLFGVPAYSTLIIYYIRLGHAIIDAIKNSGKISLKDIDYLKKKIEETEEELYGGKEAINAKKALYSEIEKGRKYEKPEEIIKRINNGDNLSEHSTYEKYQPDALKFLGDE